MASPSAEQDRPRQLINRIPESAGEDTQDDWRLSRETSREDSILDTVPAHPMPSLQQAFEESIIEANKSTKLGSFHRDVSNATAESRRRQLLKQVSFDDSWSARWKQSSSANFHPLVKLIAQIVFGLHLLHNRQAKSDAEVVHILQDHVDDIDSFLDKNTEDFDLAIRDINERLELLRLPSAHAEVFRIMLEDKTFRTQLLRGNEKIEKIIKRTSMGMNAAISDIEQGIKAISELDKYLEQVKGDWPQDYSELSEIHAAMCGNRDGWLDCLRALQMKSNELGLILVQLGTANGEIQKLAATASRSCKTPRLSSAPQSKYYNESRRSTQSRQSTHIPQQSLDKALPEEPDALASAVQATLPPQRLRIQKRRPVNPKFVPQGTTSPAAEKNTSGELPAAKAESQHEQAPRAARNTITEKLAKCSCLPVRNSKSDAVSSEKPITEQRRSIRRNAIAYIISTRSTGGGTHESNPQHNDDKAASLASSERHSAKSLDEIRTNRCVPLVFQSGCMPSRNLFRGRLKAEGKHHGSPARLVESNG